MKREILFRGQSTDSKEWIEGEFSNLFSKADICLWTSDDGKSCLRYYPVKEETVGEYIQRTDKHGTKVFEGDLVAITTKDDNGEENHDIFEVQYDDDDCRFVLFALNPRYQDINPVFTQSFFSEHAEVIGNRWDMTTDDMVKLGFIKSEVRHG